MGGDLRMWIDKDMARALQQTLERLPTSVSGKVVRSASMAAMKPVVKTARSRAPVASGQLKRSLGTVQKTYRNSGVVYTIVGARKKYDDPAPGGHKPTKISHLVERGTKPHRIVSRDTANAYNYNVVNHPGIKATYFMRKAYDSHKNEIFNVFTTKVYAGIRKEAWRLTKRVLRRPVFG